MTDSLDDRPRPLVIVGPSGVGKSTLINMLMEEFPDRFGFSISHTTRSLRGEEQNGVDYHFVSTEEFTLLRDESGFVEFAHVHSNYYGTSIQAIKSVLDEGKICILDIDVQGSEQVYHHPDYKPFMVFIRPPSLELLEERLRGRQTDSEEQIQTRLAKAQQEIDFGESSGIFDSMLEHWEREESYPTFRETIFTAYDLEN